MYYHQCVFSETSFKHLYASGYFASTGEKRKPKSSKHTGGKPPIYNLKEDFYVTYAENRLWWRVLINIKKPIEVDTFWSVTSGPGKRTCLSKLRKEEINRIYLQNAGYRISLDNSHVKPSYTSPKSCIANKHLSFYFQDFMQGNDLSHMLRPWSYRLTQSLEQWGKFCVGMISLSEQLCRKWRKIDLCL